MIHLHFLSPVKMESIILSSALFFSFDLSQSPDGTRGGWMRGAWDGKRIAKLDFHIKTGIKINSGDGERN